MGSPGSDDQAFGWTAASGFTWLGSLPGGIGFSQATAVSGDGGVIVGVSESGAGSETFRWTAGSGMTGLGDLPGSFVASRPVAVSHDGSSIAGNGTIVSGNLYGEGYRWTSTGGMQALSPRMEVQAMTGDGGTIIGPSSSGALARWTESGSNTISPISTWTSTDITLDGSTIVGYNGPGIIRWDSGVVSSQEFTPPNRFDPLLIEDVEISGDGSTLVAQGQEGLGGGSYVVIERDDLPMMTLRDYITDELGLDLAGLNPFGSFQLGGISDDGQVIVGTGINEAGWEEAWILTIPEPSTGPLVALGLVLLGFTRRDRAA